MKRIYIGEKQLLKRIKELEKDLDLAIDDNKKLRCSNNVMNGILKNFQKIQKERNLEAVNLAIEALKINNLSEASGFLEIFFEMCQEEIIYLNRNDEEVNDE